MYQRILGVVQEEMQGYMNDQLAGLMKSLGIDPAQLRGMTSGQVAFDPYLILGLDKSASDDEVKKRYRDLLHKLHPDTSGVEGTAFLLQMVLSAYEMIRRERGWQ
jgi:DnaJ-class molecular chaperone